MSLRDDAGASAWGTSAALIRGEPMLLRSIRSQLLGLVVATVVPFTALIGTGLWSQWRTDQAAAIQRARDEAQLIVAQVDDHIGNLTKTCSSAFPRRSPPIPPTSPRTMPCYVASKRICRLSSETSRCSPSTAST